MPEKNGDPGPESENEREEILNGDEQKENSIKISCLNSRSLNNKSVALVDLFDEMKLTACLINETCLLYTSDAADE